MNEIHIYRQRHVFKGDDLIAKYDVQTATIRVFEAFAGLKDEIRAWMMRTHGIPAHVLVGDEVLAKAAPLMEFPDEIRLAMRPELGDLTPEAVKYAREHFPREEFEKRYAGRVLFEPAAKPAPAPVASEPTKPAAKKTAKKSAKVSPPAESSDDDDDDDEREEIP